MPTGYLIDSETRTITEVIFDRLMDMQRLIGGHIEFGYGWPTGDVLYTDEEGLLKQPRHFFALPTCRPDQGFAGRGLVVGAEIEGDDYPNGYSHLPPKISVEDLEALIYWTSLGGTKP